MHRNELESVHRYESTQEVKSRLERELHTRITSAEWAFLKDRSLVDDYEISENWPEFRDGVNDNLRAIRKFLVDDLREQAGDPEVAPREDGADYQPEDARSISTTTARLPGPKLSVR